MAAFIFTCRETSMLFQRWLDEKADVQENEYEGLICLACTKLHFFNRKTGKLFGQDEE
jgi:hypothetical protein